MADWASLLDTQLKDYFANLRHGDYPRWQSVLDDLPALTPSQIALDSDAVTIGEASDCNDAERDQLHVQLKGLMPWRKGPFNLFGVELDTEWRSCLKWDRLRHELKPLQDKLVLDVGSGNGYYGWRMLANGARYVVGIDPTLLFMMQFRAIKHYLPAANIEVLPFGIEQLSEAQLSFDTVFSLGVLYHRRDPKQHLSELYRHMKPGGQLVLESLVIESETDSILFPTQRYAKMNNVHAIPGLQKLSGWVTKAGFNQARIIDVTPTTSAEQRQTEWMQFESLANFLDKNDSAKTIEGYPSPVRAILLADKPD